MLQLDTNFENGTAKGKWVNWLKMGHSIKCDQNEGFIFINTIGKRLLIVDDNLF